MVWQWWGLDNACINLFVQKVESWPSKPLLCKSCIPPKHKFALWLFAHGKLFTGDGQCYIEEKTCVLCKVKKIATCLFFASLHALFRNKCERRYEIDLAYARFWDRPPRYWKRFEKCTWVIILCSIWYVLLLQLVFNWSARNRALLRMKKLVPNTLLWKPRYLLRDVYLLMWFLVVICAAFCYLIFCWINVI